MTRQRLIDATTFTKERCSGVPRVSSLRLRPYPNVASILDAFPSLTSCITPDDAPCHPVYDTFFKFMRPTPTRRSTQHRLTCFPSRRRPPLSPAYEGPLTVTNRADKTITVIRNGLGTTP
ncbi:hypothetical protein M514_24249 [Trichuris suis]|uniref:Uncharacterized protein n=1 Tax=Trichuris suis TaxID=68888 RepID=A0A085N240_9BILA|nr:hypothetical protein M514_24249 [Trichuris suis]